MEKLYYKFLGFLARKYLGKKRSFVIGVNGSVGKTTCRNIISQTLQKFISDKKIYSSEIDVNWKIWLILSIFDIKKFKSPLQDSLWSDFFSYLKVFFVVVYRYFFAKGYFLSKNIYYDVLVLEYGIKVPGDMEYMISIVKPDISVFTTVDSVHLDHFEDPSQVAREEMTLVKNTLEVVFLNADDEYTSQVLGNIKVDKFTYQTIGYESKADINFDNEKIYQLDSSWDSKDNKILVRFDLFLKWKKVTIQTNALWKPSYGYIWVALLISDILKYKYEWKILTEKEYNLKYDLKPWRFDLFQWCNESWIVDWNYKNSPLSIKKTINTIYNIQKTLLSDHKIWFVLSEMEGLWDFVEKEHRLLAWYIHQTAEKVFLVGDNMTNFLADELEKIWFDMTWVYKFNKSEEAEIIIKKKIMESEEKTIVMLKGVKLNPSGPFGTPSFIKGNIGC